MFVSDRIEGMPKTECWHVESEELEDVGPEPMKEYLQDSMDIDGEATGLK